LALLSSLVIKHLLDSYRSDPTVAVGYIFLGLPDSENSETEEMLRSLSRQLFSARAPDDSAFREIRGSLSRYMEIGQSPSLSELEQALSSQLRAFSKVYLVIDNLSTDSQRKDERSELFRALLRLSEMRLGLHLFFSGRHGPLIQQEISLRFPLFPRMVILLNLQDHQHEITEDMTLLIDKELAELADYRAWPEDLKQMVKDTLVSNADGM